MCWKRCYLSILNHCFKEKQGKCAPLKKTVYGDILRRNVENGIWRQFVSNAEDGIWRQFVSNAEGGIWRQLVSNAEDGIWRQFVSKC